MLSVVTYLWSSSPESRYTIYNADHVRRLQRMVARNLTMPHDFVVVTDQPEAFGDDRDIRAVAIDWTKHVPDTCFVRLFTFSPQAKDILGERVLQLDLDTVIVGNLDALIERDEDTVLWRNPRRWSLANPDVGYAARLAHFNGSVQLHRCGTACDVWRDFDPKAPNAKDDQWLISERFGKDCPYWDDSHGVYRLLHEKRNHVGVGAILPENARIVTFPGSTGKPWINETVVENPWISDHYK